MCEPISCAVIWLTEVHTTCNTSTCSNIVYIYLLVYMFETLNPCVVLHISNVMIVFFIGMLKPIYMNI